MGNVEETLPDLLTVMGRVSVPLKGYMTAYEVGKGHAWPMRLYSAPNEAGPAPLLPYPTQLIDRKGTAQTPVKSEKGWLGAAFHALKQGINESWTQGTSGYGQAVQVGTSLVNYTTFGFYDDWDAWLAVPETSTFPA